MEIVPLQESHLEGILGFSHDAIGQNYFSAESLRAFLNPASFVLLNSQKVVGVRLTHLPGSWLKEKKHKVSSELWNVPEDQVAYFQSQYLAPEICGKGWGRKLSQKSIEALKSLEVKAVVCHSWVESPHNSSLKSLKKLGFKELKTIPEFWSEIDYICTLCQKKPCLCTAKEMILYL